MKKRLLTAVLSLCACASLNAQTATKKTFTVGNSTITTTGTPEQLERSAAKQRQSAATMRLKADTMRLKAATMQQKAKEKNKRAKKADGISKSSFKVGARNMEAGARNMEAGARNMEDGAKNMEAGAKNMELAAKEMRKSGKKAVKGDDEDRVYDVVDVMPSFPGGQTALFRYLQNTVRYPTTAIKYKASGRVLVSFVVNTDGSVGNVKVERHAHPDLDEEAVNVVKSMPRWNPGKLNGKPVRVKYTLPITFKLP